MDLKKYLTYIAILFLIVFFGVGLRGLINPSTKDHFISLFPLALFLSMMILVIFTERFLSFRFFSVFLMIALIGFLVEAAGVYTTYIFGHYTYGDTLGIKFLDTPLMIGLNWAMLVFATASVTENIRIPAGFKVLTGSSLMVLYDILLEVIAPKFGMWTWENGVVPARNYIAWFVLSMLLHALVRFLKVHTRSTTALPLLICQAVFFIFLIWFT